MLILFVLLTIFYRGNVMSTATLFLVQASFSALNTTLEQLKTLLQPEDAVVLMGDAVLAFVQTEHATLLSNMTKLYVLEADHKQIAQVTTAYPVHLLSYADWATLCLAHQRIVTLK